jgi:hypothetical protein
MLLFWYFFQEKDKRKKYQIKAALAYEPTNFMKR